MKTTHPELKAVDTEYAGVLAAYHAARARLKEVGKARAEAHAAIEYARSREAQRLTSMTDEQWEALKQRIDAARGPKVEPVVNAPQAQG